MWAANKNIKYVAGLCVVVMVLWILTPRGQTNEDAEEPKVVTNKPCPDTGRKYEALLQQVVELQQFIRNSPHSLDTLAQVSDIVANITATRQAIIRSEPTNHRWWYIEDGKLITQMQVLNLKDQFIPVPDTAAKLWIEIGANNRDTLDQQLDKNPDTFLITFEPLLDKYANLLSRYDQSQDRWRPLGHHNVRGIVLPFAVATTERGLKFNLAPVDGCSSLLEKNENSTWGTWCKETNEIRSVPSISLQTVLRMVPNGRSVDYMKVDAQGFDLWVIQSAGSEIHRIKRTTLEVVSDHCPPLYVGQPRCTEVVNGMTALGFKSSHPVTDCAWQDGCERDLEFTRP